MLYSHDRHALSGHMKQRITRSMVSSQNEPTSKSRGRRSMLSVSSKHQLIIMRNYTRTNLFYCLLRESLTQLATVLVRVYSRPVRVPEKWRPISIFRPAMTARQKGTWATWAAWATNPTAADYHILPRLI